MFLGKVVVLFANKCYASIALSGPKEGLKNPGGGHKCPSPPVKIGLTDLPKSWGGGGVTVSPPRGSDIPDGPCQSHANIQYKRRNPLFRPPNTKTVC